MDIAKNGKQFIPKGRQSVGTSALFSAGFAQAGRQTWDIVEKWPDFFRRKAKHIWICRPICSKRCFLPGI